MAFQLKPRRGTAKVHLAPLHHAHHAVEGHGRFVENVAPATGPFDPQREIKVIPDQAQRPEIQSMDRIQIGVVIVGQIILQRVIEGTGDLWRERDLFSKGP